MLISSKCVVNSNVKLLVIPGNVFAKIDHPKCPDNISVCVCVCAVTLACQPEGGVSKGCEVRI